MLFYFRTGAEEQLEQITKVGAIAVETYSYHPRTNKRKLRKFLSTAWGIKPQYIKQTLKLMHFWTPEELGEPVAVRHALYKEALEWQSNELKS